jgi:hypothetical protein
MSKEKIKGGLADYESVEDIAKHHQIDVKHIKEQLAKGIEIEHEHTNNKSIAKEIAMDHLWEDADYYTKLEKMEANEGCFKNTLSLLEEVTKRLT